ncbi:MAG TPA: Clp protease N-terminal domain-containing protein [Streptosporangiaceae bacterium]|nr:Clp protease N-terminal domain-containing protein [Streptosporangiaceae bacterium]
MLNHSYIGTEHILLGCSAKTERHRSSAGAARLRQSQPTYAEPA